MNQLFIFLRGLNYGIIIALLFYQHLHFSFIQISITIVVCFWGIWDLWKKPNEAGLQMTIGVWLEVLAVFIWWQTFQNSLVFFTLISPLTRACIHLPYIRRFLVFGGIILMTITYGGQSDRLTMWIELLVFTLILLYSSVLSELLKEREQARKILALSGFEREQQASDQERVRISRQLHDTMGQYWTAVIRSLDVAESVNEEETKLTYISKAREAAAMGLEEMRQTVRKWNEGKQTADQWLDYSFQCLERLEALTSVSIHYQKCEIPWNRYKDPVDAAEALARTILETASNAIRHGKASTINVILQTKPDKLLLVVRDNGLSFKEKEPKGNGIGLTSLRALADAQGGILTIEGAPFKGTTVYLTLPYSNNLK